MQDEFEIHEDGINISYIVCNDYIYVQNLFVDINHRGKHLPQEYFNQLIAKYDKPIVLQCYAHLISYYKHIGMLQWSPMPDGNGLYEMWYNPDNKYELG